MGVTGLLQCIKSVTDRVRITKYAGKTAAIDALAWLHRGAYGCSHDLCQGIPTDFYLRFCLDRIALLRQHGVKPIMVFDGAYISAKQDTAFKRMKQKKENRELGLKLLKAGKESEGRAQLSRAVTIGPEMVHALIKALKKRNVEILVAPYEADAQLAFLSRAGVADVVISEDSDLIAYGCRAVLFKMDSLGYGDEVRWRNLGANEDPSFLNWTEDMMIAMCILAGCDYCPGIPGVGLKRAHRIVMDNKDPPAILRNVSTQFQDKIPENYAEHFLKAFLTFKCQRVFDPLTGCVVTLNPIPADAKKWVQDGNFDFLGKSLPRPLARAIASGEINPCTLEPYPPVKIELNEEEDEMASQLDEAKENDVPLQSPVQVKVPSFSKRNWKKRSATAMEDPTASLQSRQLPSSAQQHQEPRLLGPLAGKALKSSYLTSFSSNLVSENLTFLKSADLGNYNLRKLCLEGTIPQALSKQQAGPISRGAHYAVEYPPTGQTTARKTSFTISLRQNLSPASLSDGGQNIFQDAFHKVLAQPSGAPAARESQPSMAVGFTLEATKAASTLAEEEEAYLLADFYERKWDDLLLEGEDLCP